MLTLLLLAVTCAIIALIVLAVYFGYQRTFPDPPRAEQGGYVLIDQSDSPTGLASLVVFAVFVISLIGGALLLSANIAEAQPGLATTINILALGGWLALCVLVLPYVREAWAGAPGTMELPCYPLTAGEPVEVRFSRRLRRKARVEALHATLVLVRVEKQGKSYVYERCREIPLGSRGVIEGDLVQASWDFTVPGLDADDPDDPAAAVAHLLLSGHRCHWEIEVKMPLAGLSTADSRFELPIRRRA